MRLLLTLVFVLLQAGCTAMLLGGAESGQYPAEPESGNAKCDGDETGDECQ